MKRFFLGLLWFGAIAVIGFGQQVYVFHWSRAGGQDVEINVCNLSGAQAEYSLSLYDPWGKIVWQANGTLAPYDAAYHNVSEAVKQDDKNWGLAMLKSSSPLLVCLDYYLGGKFQCTDVVNPLLSSPDEAKSYLIPFYYSQVPGTLTALVLLNPWEEKVSGLLFVYQSDGTVAFRGTFELAAYESASYSLGKLVGEGNKLWGLSIVVTQKKPVAVATKLVIEGALHVKHSTQVLISEATAQPGPTTPPKKKE